VITQLLQHRFRLRFHLFCITKLLFVVAVATGLTGCANDFDEAPSHAKKGDAKSINEGAVNNPVFHDQLIAVANEYFEYGLVNPAARMAPEDCRQPPPGPMLSESDHSDTHGKKLYFLFAKNSDHYLRQDSMDSPNSVRHDGWLCRFSFDLRGV